MRFVRATVCAAVSLLALASAAFADTRGATVKVINGHAVPAPDFATRWPFMAALVVASRASEYDGQFCGASVIDANLVVTAAHCVAEESDGDIIFAAPSSLDVVTGRRTLDDDNVGQRLDVSGIYVHPNFDPDTLLNDVAVVRLAAPSSATPIALVGAGETALWGGGSGIAVSTPNGPWVAGWGNRSAFNTSFPYDLYEAEVPIKSDTTCNSDAQGGASGDFKVASMVCAGILDSDDAPEITNGIDTCQGDSGGPLIVDDTVGGFRLAGITSWGIGCAGSIFGFYTRVDAMRAWIAAIPSPSGGEGGILDPIGAHDSSTGLTGTRMVWLPPASGPAPTSYRTYLEVDGWQYPLGTSVGTSMNVAGLAPGAAYSFVIKSVDSSGNESSGSAVAVETMPDNSRPSRPTGLRLIERNQTSMRIAWNVSRDNVHVFRYRVYRRDRSGWHVACLVNARTHSCKLGNLKRHHRYHWRVRAVDTSGNNSFASAIKRFSTL